MPRVVIPQHLVQVLVVYVVVRVARQVHRPVLAVVRIVVVRGGPRVPIRRRRCAAPAPRAKVVGVVVRPKPVPVLLGLLLLRLRRCRVVGMCRRVRVKRRLLLRLCLLLLWAASAAKRRLGLGRMLRRGLWPYIKRLRRGRSRRAVRAAAIVLMAAGAGRIAPAGRTGSGRLGVRRGHALCDGSSQTRSRRRLRSGIVRIVAGIRRGRTGTRRRRRLVVVLLMLMLLLLLLLMLLLLLLLLLLLRIGLIGYARARILLILVVCGRRRVVINGGRIDRGQLRGGLLKGRGRGRRTAL